MFVPLIPIDHLLLAHFHPHEFCVSTARQLVAALAIERVYRPLTNGVAIGGRGSSIRVVPQGAQIPSPRPEQDRTPCKTKFYQGALPRCGGGILGVCGT